MIVGAARSLRKNTLSYIVLCGSHTVITVLDGAAWGYLYTLQGE